MSFIDVQNEFMAHIREPKKNKKPTDIEDRRINFKLVVLKAQDLDTFVATE